MNYYFDKLRTVATVICWVLALSTLYFEALQDVVFRLEHFGATGLVDTSISGYIDMLVFCIIVAVVGSIRAPASHWKHFTGIFAVHAICFAIFTNFFAVGRIHIKSLDCKADIPQSQDCKGRFRPTLWPWSRTFSASSFYAVKGQVAFSYGMPMELGKPDKRYKTAVLMRA
jgi:hypothetical protein